jgi:DNA-binding XRE family transcriptional regulator
VLILSLFPGIGLLDKAFEEEGYCVVRGPDPLWGGDVRNFHPPAGRFDGIIGGPQPMKPKTLQVEPIYVLIGQRIRHVREFLGKTQADVAEACGLTRTSIVNIESGRQRFMLHDMEKIAAALKLTPKRLLRGLWTE